VQQSEEVKKAGAEAEAEHEVEPAEHGPSQTPDPLANQLAPADWAAADEMRRRTFSVVEHGYDQAEVRAYLSHLAEVFAHQASKVSELRRAETSNAHNGGEDASGLASKIADVLREAEEHATRLREEAEGEAKLILAGAHQRAEQAERDGEQIAADARREVHEEAERKVAAAEQRAQQAKAEAEQRAQQAKAEAQRAVAEAERRAADAEAVREAVVAEVRSAWQRVSQAVAVPAEALETPTVEAAVQTPPAPQRPA
jgi:vacuolar-type H+-ATPase subunit E/Vma4